MKAMSYPALFLLSLVILSSTSTSRNYGLTQPKRDLAGILAQPKRDLAGIVCGLVNCSRGVCEDSSSLPFYRCECEEGWTSPGGISWIPCVLPNCSLDLDCNHAGTIAPPPAAVPTDGVSNICSLPICGDGECISSGNSSFTHECKCNTGSTNLFNTSDGYCLPSCALGGGCSGLNISLGGSPPPPASQNSSQGISSSPSLSNQNGPSSQGTKQALASNRTIISGMIMLLIGWCSYFFV